MDILKNKKLVVSVLVLLILGLAWYIYSDLKKVDSNLADNSSGDNLSDDDIKNLLGIDYQGDGITIEQIPVTELPDAPIPNLDRKLVFPEAFNAEAQAIFIQKINSMIAGLKKDPSRADLWFDYGAYLNAINDFGGAIEAWHYLSLLTPTNPEVYSNLGFVYGYDLKNTAEAEKNYNLALKYGGDKAVYYQRMAEFYIDVVGDKSKALAIIDQGLIKIPGDATLASFKEGLK